MGKVTEGLARIQGKLKVPKNQHNSFGNYDYRSAEDILDALKPLLVLEGLYLLLGDEVVNIGNKNYVKAIATLANGTGEVLSVSAFAREAEIQKGMSEAQITGSTSSYARKYALNGMFLIDDTKDDDTRDTTEKPLKQDEKPTEQPKTASSPKKIVEKFDITAECHQAVRNENKKRSEYTVVTEDNEKYVVFIKKDIQAMAGVTKVILKGFSESIFNNKTYYWADDIKKVTAEDIDM